MPAVARNLCPFMTKICILCHFQARGYWRTFVHFLKTLSNYLVVSSETLRVVCPLKKYFKTIARGRGTIAHFRLKLLFPITFKTQARMVNIGEF